MRKDLTDITLVVDRSGSMQYCRDDAEGGINSFIKEQKKVEGEASFAHLFFSSLSWFGFFRQNYLSSVYAFYGNTFDYFSRGGIKYNFRN